MAPKSQKSMRTWRFGPHHSRVFITWSTNPSRMVHLSSSFLNYPNCQKVQVHEMQIVVPYSRFFFPRLGRGWDSQAGYLNLLKMPRFACRILVSGARLTAEMPQFKQPAFQIPNCSTTQQPYCNYWNGFPPKKSRKKNTNTRKKRMSLPKPKQKKTLPFHRFKASCGLWSWCSIISLPVCPTNLSKTQLITPNRFVIMNVQNGSASNFSTHKPAQIPPENLGRKHVSAKHPPGAPSPRAKALKSPPKVSYYEPPSYANHQPTNQPTEQPTNQWNKITNLPKTKPSLATGILLEGGPTLTNPTQLNPSNHHGPHWIPI